MELSSDLGGVKFCVVFERSFLRGSSAGDCNFGERVEVRSNHGRSTFVGRSKVNYEIGEPVCFFGRVRKIKAGVAEGRIPVGKPSLTGNETLHEFLEPGSIHIANS